MFFIPTPPLCFLNLILAKTNCLVKVDFGNNSKKALHSPSPKLDYRAYASDYTKTPELLKMFTFFVKTLTISKTFCKLFLVED